MSKKIKFSKNNPETRRDKSPQAPSWHKQDELLTQPIDRRGFLNLSALFAATAASSTLWTPNSQAGTTSTALSGTATQTIPTPALWYRNSGLSSYSDGSNITTWANEGTLGTGYNLGQYSSNSVPQKATRNGFGSANFSSDVMRFSNSGTIQLIPSSGYNRFTMFMVFEMNNSYFSYFSNYPYSTAGSIGWYGTTGNTRFYHDNDGTSNTISSGTMNSMTQHGIRTGTTSSNNSTFSYWQQNTSSITTTTYSTYGANLSIGGLGYMRTNHIGGYLFELMLYQSALTDTEVNQVRQYLASTFPGTDVAG